MTLAHLFPGGHWQYGSGVAAATESMVVLDTKFLHMASLLLSTLPTTSVHFGNDKSPCLVSVGSIWEVAIKHQLGNLPISAADFRDQSLLAGATILPIQEDHVIETGQLPSVHNDPFDRLLIAQARVEGLMAVSADARWPGYDVSLHRV